MTPFELTPEEERRLAVHLELMDRSAELTRVVWEYMTELAGHARSEADVFRRISLVDVERLLEALLGFAPPLALPPEAAALARLCGSGAVLRAPVPVVRGLAWAVLRFVHALPAPATAS